MPVVGCVCELQGRRVPFQVVKGASRSGIVCGHFTNNKIECTGMPSFNFGQLPSVAGCIKPMVMQAVMC